VIATKAELDAWGSAASLRGSTRLCPVKQDSDALLKALKLGIGEIHRLRIETNELRKRLMEALELLHTNLRFALPGDVPSFEQESAMTRPSTVEIRR
jgi:regulator of replication initiation timing